ncbi:SDR family NAD(P)-dependent oxidoreductase [Aureimonas sp. SK2]|uniref:SDR family NAD(P)-dependent oxidoreductase n=1 Tax=Aureimonas sp. SK2 TaxID=3015992 RepID=UPI002444C4BA|nr:SDR family NAD(P)-dependent oxidoreductase [Aureimonas sp. SK2]
MTSTARPLSGRTALVTGAARNIGRAIALALAGAGADVAIATRADREGADRVAEDIFRLGGRCRVILGDVGREEDVARYVSETIEAFGRLDILVNNAAIRRETPLAELSFSEWREVMATALDGPFLLAKVAAPYLRSSSAGTIVNIGGLSAYTGASRRAHVVVAKAGLDGLTKALAHELGADGVTVNLVSPGLIETERGGTSSPTAPAHHANSATLLARRGTSEEVASAVLFLCGPEARYITGQTIHVNGGAFLP